MKYKCLKCGEEFEVISMQRVECPKCGAQDWDCEPLRKYKLSHPETPVEVPVVVGK
jgi:predicted  nucleic acid-binding Zn-ribbon protein